MDKYKATKVAGILGILGNVFLLFIKGITGFTFNSQAMIADAANSAGDIFASLMTFIGNKIASEPGDSTHNFGHGKAEYIFSLFISISMIIIALKLFYDSCHSLFYGSNFSFSWTLVIVCIITIVLKFALFLFTHILYNKYNNILLKANSEDHRNDCIVTTLTLFSVFLSLLGINWFDGVVGLGISIWICFAGIKIFIESYNVLMDIALDTATSDLILDLAHSYKDIKSVGDMYSTPVGYQYIVVLTIFVDGNMSTFDSHSLADSLEKDISKLERIYHVIIHVNPI